MRNVEEAAAGPSVDHARVVEDYRSAYRIAERSRRGAADTEELRRALVYYRALFEELLEDREPNASGAKRPPVSPECAGDAPTQTSANVMKGELLLSV